jgi:hypothetical protein
MRHSNLKTLGAATGFVFRVAVYIEQAHVCAMNRIQCNCGAIYEAVDPKGRTRDLNLFKCLVCGKELMSAKAYKVGDLRLISRPEPDRE